MHGESLINHAWNRCIDDKQIRHFRQLATDHPPLLDTHTPTNTDMHQNRASHSWPTGDRHMDRENRAATEQPSVDIICWCVFRLAIQTGVVHSIRSIGLRERSGRHPHRWTIKRHTQTDRQATQQEHPSQYLHVSFQDVTKASTWVQKEAIHFVCSKTENWQSVSQSVGLLDLLIDLLDQPPHVPLLGRRLGQQIHTRTLPQQHPNHLRLPLDGVLRRLALLLLAQAHGRQLQRRLASQISVVDLRPV
mmetsp:Transcript_16125/g.38536  ORF Transcript_16125/g.38536 Transcript_16125/m.38536 type:complete len:248 (-) Transcript_16125:279-1022(-)